MGGCSSALNAKGFEPFGLQLRASKGLISNVLIVPPNEPCVFFENVSLDTSQRMRGFGSLIAPLHKP
jgi:hypothetical protein